MTISPATNVVDAYKQCNPDYALPADDNRYIDLSEVRGENIKSLVRFVVVLSAQTIILVLI